MSRRISERQIQDTVKALFIKANNVLRPDVFLALNAARRREKVGTVSAKMMSMLVENARIAREESIPICQDTGMATVFLEIGMDVDTSGIDVVSAVNKGVARAYKEGFFRQSVVKDPILRGNTRDNTPAMVHIDMVKGSKIGIHVMPKGFGSENKSRSVMLNPTAGVGKIFDFCVDTVKMAGPDACPPYVLGIGIGGTAEVCALLAKKALLRPINKRNKEKHLAKLERMIAAKANRLGIGVMGLGGKTTVLGVNIEACPTHIAGLPVAVNVSCHALRSASAII